MQLRHNNGGPDSSTSGARLERNQKVAALLPPDAYTALRQVLSEAQFIPSRSWDELGRVAESRSVGSIVIDPYVAGSDLGPAISFLRRFRLVPTLAYVSLSPENFHAVAKLSNEGLYAAFIHPLCDSGQRLRALHEKLGSDTLARGLFLGTLEPAAGRLPVGVVRAVIDLFGRPHRYRTATDLAAQSEVIPRHLYRDFEAVHLGSPRKLVLAAKMLRAYGYLREPHHSVESVSEKLGYESVRVFSRNTRQVFGCCPSTLRKESNAEEVVMQLLEWYHKPTNPAVSDTNSLLRRLKSQRFGPGTGVRSSEELTC